MSKFDRFRESIRRWRIFRTLWLYMMRWLQPWLVLCRIHSRTLRKESSASSLAGNITVRLAVRAELIRAAETISDQLSEDFIDSAISRGDLCVAAFDESTIVSFAWISFSTAPLGDGLWIGFEKPYRYGYNSYTRPEYRGRWLQSHVILFADQICIDRGYTHAITYVETHNYPAIRSGQRRNSRLVGFAGYIKLFGKVFPFRTRGAKKHTFRIYRSAEIQ